MVLFVKIVIFALLGIVATASSGQAETVLPQLPGITLPDTIDWDGVFAVSHSLGRVNCRTPSCIAFGVVVEALENYDEPDHALGSNVWTSKLPQRPTRNRMAGENIARLLRQNMRLRPEICLTLTAIAARSNHDDPQLDPGILELARRISTNGSDCLGEVLKTMPRGPLRTESLKNAREFCVSDPKNDCRRLRP